MSKDPAFLLYSSDFLTGTSDLTNGEIGVYIKLLCLQHQKGRLTKKTMHLQCRGIEATDVHSKFLIDENGLYYNKRLEEEVEKRNQHSKKQSDRAKKGWIKRKATAYATALPLEDEDEDDITFNNKGVENFKIEFCNIYPKAGNPFDILSALQTLPKDEQKKAMDFVPIYIKNTESKYYKTPVNYLNSYCWNDKTTTPKAKGGYVI